MHFEFCLRFFEICCDFFCYSVKFLLELPSSSGTAENTLTFGFEILLQPPSLAFMATRDGWVPYLCPRGGQYARVSPCSHERLRRPLSHIHHHHHCFLKQWHRHMVHATTHDHHYCKNS